MTAGGSGPSGASRSVPSELWASTVEQARADGFTYFDWLGCIDEVGRSNALRVVLMLRNLDAPGADPLLVSTDVPRDSPELDSVTSIFAGAGWHEREAAELFGVTFRGGDPRRLLLAAAYEGTPLRKDEVLAARAGTSWPGGKEPGESGAPGRRRMVPPGVPDPAVWGDRADGEAPAEAEEVAESTVAGRVRRRER
jgi:NADH-quinone oxidoreductase subunit C